MRKARSDVPAGLLVDVGSAWPAVGVAYLSPALLGGPQYHPSHGIRIVFEGAYAEGWGQWQGYRTMNW